MWEAGGGGQLMSKEARRASAGSSARPKCLQSGQACPIALYDLG